MTAFPAAQSCVDVTPLISPQSRDIKNSTAIPLRRHRACLTAGGKPLSCLGGVRNLRLSATHLHRHEYEMFASFSVDRELFARMLGHSAASSRIRMSYKNDRYHPAPHDDKYAGTPMSDGQHTSDLRSCRRCTFHDATSTPGIPSRLAFDQSSLLGIQVHV